MAYDRRRHRTVMLRNGSSVVWEWDGASWTSSSPALHPSDTIGAAMAYDEARGLIVVRTTFEALHQLGQAVDRGPLRTHHLVQLVDGCILVGDAALEIVEARGAVLFGSRVHRFVPVSCAASVAAPRWRQLTAP